MCRVGADRLDVAPVTVQAETIQPRFGLNPARQREDTPTPARRGTPVGESPEAGRTATHTALTFQARPEPKGQRGPVQGRRLPTDRPLAVRAIRALSSLRPSRGAR